MIVYTDMVGDLFHYGHIQLLKRIKTRFSESRLYVGVHNDECVRAYKRLPIMTMTERARTIRECQYVDQVIVDAPLIITDTWLQQHNIDYVVHAHDVTDTQYDHMYAVPMQLGKFIRFDYTTGVSTTDIINRIVSRYRGDVV